MRTVIYRLPVDGTGTLLPVGNGVIREICATFLDDGAGLIILSPVQSAVAGNTANLIEIKTTNGGVATSPTVLCFRGLTIPVAVKVPLYAQTTGGVDVTNSQLYVTVEYA